MRHRAAAAKPLRPTSVRKEARVTEEVAVRKRAEERTETVSDTVRRTEVEVEDERGRTGTTERRDKV
jgi:stress response protein YsnF